MTSNRPSISLRDSSDSSTDTVSALPLGKTTHDYGKRRRATPIPDTFVKAPPTRRPLRDQSPSISEDESVPSSRRPSGLHDSRLQHLSKVQQAQVIVDVVENLASEGDWTAMAVYLGAVGQHMTMQVPDDMRLSSVRKRLSDRIAMSEQHVCAPPVATQAAAVAVAQTDSPKPGWLIRLLGCSSL